MALTWRAHVSTFAAEGWQSIAPTCGYGGSSAPAAMSAYSIHEALTDMAELHDHLGRDPRQATESHESARVKRGKSWVVCAR